VLFKRRVIVITTLLLSALLMVGGVYMIEPTYKATVLILVRPAAQQQLILFPGLETPGPVDFRINQARNLVAFSTSRTMAASLVRTFDLAGPKEPQELRDHIKYWARRILRSPIELLEELKLKKKKTPDYVTEAADDLIDHLDVEVQQDTQIIDLTVWGSSPTLSAELANALALQLVEKTRDLVRQQAEEAYSFTGGQVVMAEKTLRQAEETLMQFKVDENIVLLDQERQLILDRLDSVEMLKSATVADLEEATAKVTEIKRQLGEQPEMLLSTSVMSVNRVSQELRGVLHELSAQLSAVLVEKAALHPEAAALRAQIQEIKEQLSDEQDFIKESETAELNPVRQSLLVTKSDSAAKVAALEAKLATWNQEIAAIETAAADMSRKETALTRLEREKETHEERYRALKTKLLELEVQRLTESSDYDIRIVDPAYVPQSADPDHPSWELAGYVIPPLAILLALGIPFLLEYLNDTFDTPAAAESAVGLPVIGCVPSLRGRKRAAARRRAAEAKNQRDDPLPEICTRTREEILPTRRPGRAPQEGTTQSRAGRGQPPPGGR
jgi:uncharacterized protein involved in exopolysaccharide biosynthesis